MKDELKNRRLDRDGVQTARPIDSDEDPTAGGGRMVPFEAEPRKRRNRARTASLLASMPETEIPAGKTPVNESFQKEVFEFFFEHVCRRRPIALKRLMDEIERNIILKVMGDVEWNQKAASSVLGLNYTTLNAKVRKHGILSSRIDSSGILSGES